MPAPVTGTAGLNVRVRRRVVAAVAGVLALGLLGWVAVSVLHWFGRVQFPLAPPLAACDLAGTSFTVTPEQAGNAATVAAVALDRGLPEQAVVIALATAMQESKLVNVEYGDRDSLGLFQQRPSQGWGTPKQILDPVYATGKFYDALVAIHGWRRLPVAEVAQRIQQSAYPAAYARWEPQAGALAHVLVGRVPAGVSCRFESSERPAEQPGPSGLTPRAAAVLAAAHRELGSRRVAAGGDPPERPGQVLALAPAGWFTANWLVAHAEATAVRQVGYAGRIWTPDRGWHPAGTGTAAPTPDGSGAAPADRVLVLVG